MLKFVTALNSISSQPLAIIVLCIGCWMLVVSKKLGIDTTISGGIIGIAGNMLQATVTKTHTEGDGDTLSQTTQTPGAFITPKQS
jgi:hypothetical protein